MNNKDKFSFAPLPFANLRVSSKAAAVPIVVLLILHGLLSSISSLSSLNYILVLCIIRIQDVWKPLQGTKNDYDINENVDNLLKNIYFRDNVK